MENNNTFMEQALRCAFSAMGSTSPNPAVGAVIVKNGAATSSGCTCECGSDHAEVDAIKRAGEGLAGAELYVTLEPCCHYGKTPPCTDAIIKAGISRVHVPMLDPNPRVMGEGVRILRSHGVEVILDGRHFDAAYDLVRPFRKFITTGMPFIVHKAALTMDGRTATPTGDSKWISGEHSRFLAHRLRSRVDAVIVGKNTVQCDNPSLTVRFESFPDGVRDYFNRTAHRQNGRENFFLRMLLDGDSPCECREPLRVVVGMPDHVSPGMNIIGDGRFLFYARESGPGELRGRRDREYIETLSAGEKIVFTGSASPVEMVNYILKDLGARGIMFAMLEGGARLAGSFLGAGALDQALFVIAPKIAGAGLPPVEGGGVDRIADARPMFDTASALVAGDLVYTAYREAAGQPEKE